MYDVFDKKDIGQSHQPVGRLDIFPVLVLIAIACHGLVVG